MTRMDGGHRCTSTLTHRVWFLNKHILVGNGQTANSNMSVLVANDISDYIPEAQNLPRTVDSKETNVLSASCLMSCFILCHASYQFAHAALLSHSILTFVVEAHLAGFAAEAVLCRVSRQEHHMLGCCTWYAHRKEATGSDLSCQELDSNAVSSGANNKLHTKRQR